jgi:hypothetical protein
MRVAIHRQRHLVGDEREKVNFLLVIGISFYAAESEASEAPMYGRQREHAYRPNPAVLEHLGYRWESSLRGQEGNYQGLLMLVHPPTEGFFRRELWSLQGNTRLPVRGGMHFMRLLVVDGDAHDIEVNHRAQLACQKPEQFLRRSD